MIILSPLKIKRVGRSVSWLIKGFCNNMLTKEKFYNSNKLKMNTNDKFISDSFENVQIVQKWSKCFPKHRVSYNFSLMFFNINFRVC